MVMQKRSLKLPTGTAVTVGVKTDRRCKICVHPKRLEIEALMVKQANGECNEDGSKLSRQYICSYAEREWGFYLTTDNIQSHEKNHFQYRKSVDRMTSQLEGQSSRLLQLAVATEGLGRVDRKALLDEFIVAGMGHIRDNEGATITPDLVLRAIDLQRKEGEQGGVQDVWKAAAGSMSINVNVNTNKAKISVEEDAVDVEVEEEE